MTPFHALGLHLALAGFVLGAGAGSILVAVLGSAVLRGSLRRDQVALLRLTPLLLGLLLGGGTLAAWVTHEPRQTRQEVRLPLHAAAGLGALLAAGGALRAVRTWRATRRLWRGWAAAGRPCALPGWRGAAWRFPARHPVVAVVGCLRPRLFLSEPALALLDREELAAVLAHERAHVAGRDNLTLLLLRSLPDPLAFLPAGRGLVRAWRAASERAADAAVHGLGAVPAAALASALLRVGRLLPEADPLPVSTLHDGSEDLAGRVGRLLSPAPEPAGLPEAGPVAGLLAALAAAAALLLGTPALWLLHRACEDVVRLGS